MIIHYLGHAAFVLIAGGARVLMDYGTSGAYGLDSPVYDVGGSAPDVMTLSHGHADHDRGLRFEGTPVLAGLGGRYAGLSFRALPVSEGDMGNTTAYLVSHAGTTVLHAGDCQGDIVGLADGRTPFPAGVMAALPERVDVLLLPVGWVRDIVPEALAFAAALRPRVVVPMHYWSPADRDRFLALARDRGSGFRVEERRSPRFDTDEIDPADERILAVGLDPAPWEGPDAP